MYGGKSQVWRQNYHVQIKVIDPWEYVKNYPIALAEKKSKECDQNPRNRSNLLNKFLSSKFPLPYF
jgi:hypothetical protein